MKAKSTLSMEGTLNAKTHAGRLINFELNLQFKFLARRQNGYVKKRFWTCLKQMALSKTKLKKHHFYFDWLLMGRICATTRTKRISLLTLSWLSVANDISFFGGFFWGVLCPRDGYHDSGWKITSSGEKLLKENIFSFKRTRQNKLYGRQWSPRNQIN